MATMTRTDRASLTLGSLLFLGSAPLLPFLLVTSDPPGVLLYQGLTWQRLIAELGMMFESGDDRPLKLIMLAEFIAGVLLIERGLLRAFAGLKFTIWRLMFAVMIVALGLASPLLGFLWVVMAVLAPVLLAIFVLLRKPAGAPDNRPHETRS
jgi:hypothetical protein